MQRLICRRCGKEFNSQYFYYYCTDCFESGKTSAKPMRGFDKYKAPVPPHQTLMCTFPGCDYRMKKGKGKKYCPSHQRSNGKVVVYNEDNG